MKEIEGNSLHGIHKQCCQKIKFKRYWICTSGYLLYFEIWDWDLIFIFCKCCVIIFKLYVISPLSVSRILHLCWSDFYITSAGWFLHDGSLCPDTADCCIILVIILDQPWCLSCKGATRWVPQIDILHAVFESIHVEEYSTTYRDYMHPSTCTGRFMKQCQVLIVMWAVLFLPNHKKICNKKQLSIQHWNTINLNMIL